MSCIGGCLNVSANHVGVRITYRKQVKVVINPGTSGTSPFGKEQRLPLNGPFAGLLTTVLLILTSGFGFLFFRGSRPPGVPLHDEGARSISLYRVGGVSRSHSQQGRESSHQLLPLPSCSPSPCCSSTSPRLSLLFLSPGRLARASAPHSPAPRNHALFRLESPHLVSQQTSLLLPLSTSRPSTSADIPLLTSCTHRPCSPSRREQ